MLSVNHSLHCKTNGNVAPNFKCLDRITKIIYYCIVFLLLGIQTYHLLNAKY